MKAIAAKINNVLAWVILIGANIQFFLIALSFFDAADSGVHAFGGFILMITGLLLLISALLARHSWANIGLSALIFVLLPVMGMLVHTEGLSGFVRAIHAAGGLTVLWVSYLLAYGRYRATAPKLDTTTAAAAAD